jgi:hypothetical protein
MQSSISILRHLIKDHQYKEDKINKAQKRILEKIKHMGEHGVQYTAQMGNEVDKSNQQDEAMLMPNDPDLMDDNDIFNRRQFLEQKRKKQMEKEKNQQNKGV